MLIPLRLNGIHRRRLRGQPGHVPPNNWETPMHLSLFTTFFYPQYLGLPTQYLWQVFASDGINDLLGRPTFLDAILGIFLGTFLSIFLDIFPGTFLGIQLLLAIFMTSAVCSIDWVSFELGATIISSWRRPFGGDGYERMTSIALGLFNLMLRYMTRAYIV